MLSHGQGFDRPSQPLRAHNAIPRDQVLDAAHDLVIEVGLRGLTMADLARRADVSRATLYRTWPNVNGVVADLFTRDFHRALEGVVRGISGGDARTILVATTVGLVREIRRLPLLRRVIELDPQFLTPYILHRRGSSTREQARILEGLIRDGQNDGSIRAGDTAVLTAAVLLDAWAFVLTAPVFVEEDDLDALDEELTTMLERYLHP
ncbi:TetR/AcrR family transcriptional regulator [Mumia zhuanghuii]|uniref:TetR/AcrR family transcriptional regulator n=2 Tax=Mumia TaxID=1546255 RepID=A0ABW1QSH7_9ACTN|nr:MULTISPECIES: TetR/AcrR family transcriptional regulator [Mumia]KAA1420062.1 TetR/AcrR family transcriptional regulator [Mumia zhuanghuii]